VKKGRHRRTLRFLEVFFWCLAFVLLGCYAYVYLDRSVYQAYEAWSFDRRLEHRPVSVIGFLWHSIGIGETEWVSKDTGNVFARPAVPAVPPAHREPVPSGALLGRIEIPRVGVSSMILNGTTAKCLRRAVGHIEGTPLFGTAGNVGLAGHRDTFFRGLRLIRKGDVIRVETLEGTYEYVVESTQIVGPDDVEVLDASIQPVLTLVTCYPFDYIGSAPRRFIVRAREVAGPGVRPQPSQGS
jgi:sortase A